MPADVWTRFLFFIEQNEIIMLLWRSILLLLCVWLGWLLLLLNVSITVTTKQHNSVDECIHVCYVKYMVARVHGKRCLLKYFLFFRVQLNKIVVDVDDSIRMSGFEFS